MIRKASIINRSPRSDQSFKQEASQNMRVFVTGATGFVGSAVVQELISNGHQVLGLSRSDRSAAKLADLGAEALRGDLSDDAALRKGANSSDAIAHLGFNHDFSNFAAGAAQDSRAIRTMGEVFKGSKRPILATSGFEYLTDGELATEATIQRPVSDIWPRASEAEIMSLARDGVRSAYVRFATSVHGTGEHGFVPALIGIARTKGVAAYVGDGQNVWPGVHRSDAARVYRLALEHGALEKCYHAVDEEGVPFRAIAEVIGQGLGLPVVSIDPGDAERHFGWFGQFATMSMPASSLHTRHVLNWTPSGPRFLEDIGQSSYYRT